MTANVAVTIALIVVLIYKGARYMDERERDARRELLRQQAWYQMHQVEHETRNWR